jgi:hypothetical protein
MLMAFLSFYACRRDTNGLLALVSHLFRSKKEKEKEKREKEKKST